MLLVLTNSRDATADYLCRQLDGKRLSYTRLDTDTLSASIRVSYLGGRPRLQLESAILQPSEITNIWFRRPHSIEVAADSDSARNQHARAEWAEAMEGFLAHVPIKLWMNHPSSNTLASHKLEQLSRACNYGLRIPKTLLTQDPEELCDFYASLEGKVIAKPLATGFIERAAGADSAIYTSSISTKHIANSDLVRNCPTLFQEEIVKETDVRIIFVDGEVTAASLTTEKGTRGQLLDIRRHNMVGVNYESVKVPAEIAKRLKSLVSSYGLRFAAVDMAVDTTGNWIFFEINPNGQWAWLDIVGATDASSLFLKAFTEESCEKFVNRLKRQ